MWRKVGSTCLCIYNESVPWKKKRGRRVGRLQTNISLVCPALLFRRATRRFESASGSCLLVLSIVGSRRRLRGGGPGVESMLASPVPVDTILLLLREPSHSSTTIVYSFPPPTASTDRSRCLLSARECPSTFRSRSSSTLAAPTVSYSTVCLSPPSLLPVVLIARQLTLALSSPP